MAMKQSMPQLMAYSKKTFYFSHVFGAEQNQGGLGCAVLLVLLVPLGGASSCVCGLAGLLKYQLGLLPYARHGWGTLVRVILFCACLILLGPAGLD